MKKKRFILGEGYPWAMGVGPDYCELALRASMVGGKNLPLVFPKKWWSIEVPKVRLVAEIIEPIPAQGER